MEVNKESRKQLIKDYKNSVPEIGLYAIKNKLNNKIFLGMSLNLNGPFGRHQFELRMGNHPCKSMQNDFNSMGEESLSFEILDKLKRNDNPFYDYKPDLIELLELWKDKLRNEGFEVYNNEIPEKMRFY